MSLRYFRLADRILDRNRVTGVVWEKRAFMGIWQRNKPFQVRIGYEGMPVPFFYIARVVIPINNMLRGMVTAGVVINFETEKEAIDASAKVERLRIKEFAE